MKCHSLFHNEGLTTVRNLNPNLRTDQGKVKFPFLHAIIPHLHFIFLSGGTGHYIDSTHPLNEMFLGSVSGHSYLLTQCWDCVSSVTSAYYRLFKSERKTDGPLLCVSISVRFEIERPCS